MSRVNEFVSLDLCLDEVEYRTTNVDHLNGSAAIAATLNDATISMSDAPEQVQQSIKQTSSALLISLLLMFMMVFI